VLSFIFETVSDLKCDRVYQDRKHEFERAWLYNELEAVGGEESG